MSEYRYIIQYHDTSCLYLAGDGPHKESMEFIQELLREGFQQVSEQPMGENMLRVLKRDAIATDIGASVLTDPYSGRKTKG
jgi:hypothetical protein